MTATTSHSWPHKTAVVIDPARRKSLFIIFLVIVSILLWGLKGNDVVRYFADKNELEALRPKMSLLADQGKPEAIAWMIMHDSAFFAKDDDFTSLKAAADAGHAESMYLYGGILKWKKADSRGDAYIARAAAEGYPDAIKELSRKR
jgi:TPR repeat protein